MMVIEWSEAVYTLRQFNHAALCLMALPRYGKRTERSPRTGRTYTVDGWSWPFLPWPRNRKGFPGGNIVWHPEEEGK